MDENRELFKKYITGDCTKQELIRVKQLLKDPKAENFLQELLDQDWETFQMPRGNKSALQVYRQKFVQERKASLDQDSKMKLSPGTMWLRYAAVLLLMMGFGAYFIFNGKSSKVKAIAMLEKYNPRGQRSIITLSDSTIIYLGADSKVKFPEHFVGNTREMELQGEAFFQVKKDPKHPFIIHTGKVQTRVLGTSFKIESFKGQLLSVSVATGKVRVDQTNHQSAARLSSLAVLTPGQKVTWNPLTNKTVKDTVSIADLQEWTKGKLVFSGQRLDEVAEILARHYNVKIGIAGRSTSAYRVNATFNADESITKVMRILSVTAKFKFKMEGNTIKINKI